MQDFFLVKHIQQSKTITGSDQPPLLDLLFTRQGNKVDNLMYSPPSGKSDHVMLEWDFIVSYSMVDGNESCKKQLN